MRLKLLSCTVVCALIAQFMFAAPFAATSHATGVAAKQAAPAEARPQQKLALLVGIDRYQNKSIPPLRGTKNDVENMKRLLIDSFGFPDNQKSIRTLIDAEATHDAIVSSFEEHLIAQADADTIVVFHYCGHGSQKRDQPPFDEPDGWDETLVPYDSGRGSDPNRDITDDQLNALMLRLNEKTDLVTFIFDSCHSGSATRSIGGGLARKVERDERGLARSVGPAPEGTREGGDQQERARYTLIAGARDHEEAKEKRIHGKTYGALTWYLAEEIRNALETKENATYRDIMDLVKAKVSSDFPSQHPVLEGSGAENIVFGARSHRSEPYILVTRISGETIDFEAGQVHGITEGSVFEIYPPGTKKFEEPSGVRAEVTYVGVTNSTAKVIEGKVSETQSRAVERSHAYPLEKIALRFKGLEESETLREVRAQLISLDHLTESVGETDFDLLIEVSDEAIVIEGAVPHELSPRVSLAAPNVSERVLEKVTQWARWLEVLRLRNHDPRAQVELIVRRPEGARDVSSFQQRKADLELLVDEAFEVQVRNTSRRPLYLTLLAIGSDGTVAVVYPESEEEQQAVAPGKTAWPEDSPLSLTASIEDSRVHVARDVLKVIATTVPVDYSFLEVSGDFGSRTVGRRRRPKPVRWSTLERVIETRRFKQ